MRETRAERAVAYSGAIRGIKTRMAPNRTVTLAGQDYTPAELIAVFQAVIDAFRQTDVAYASYLQRVRDEHKIEAAAKVVSDAFKRHLTATVKRGSAEVEYYGYKPDKIPKKSVKSKVAAIEKAKATREARHTMGPKQKARIKGTPPKGGSG